MAYSPVRWPRTIGVVLLTITVLTTFACRSGTRLDHGVGDSAGAVLDASGIKGGLVVVIGCDDPTLLADLRRAGPYLVHALEVDPRMVAAAREYLREKGLYGSVTVSRLRGVELPFVDSLVNLIVLRDDTQVPTDEMERTLAPGGAIINLSTSTAAVTWKDWPEELDEWPQYLYDATNNAVSHDTVVGPPRGLRWTAGPAYGRSHEHFGGVSAMVTAGGRMFAIVDEGPISSVFLPAQWNLVARDAFNGVLLWKRPIAKWEAHLRGFRSGPPEIARRIVATGDRLYAALDYGDPVTVLDAATGREHASLVGTGGTRELVLTGRTLYVLADDMTGDDHEKRKEWIDQTAKIKPYHWPYPHPRKVIHMYGTQRILAVDTDSGRTLWQRDFHDPGEIMPATMAVDQERVCLQTVSHVVCLDASNGGESWRSERPLAPSRLSWSTPTLVVHDGVVLTVDRLTEANADNAPPEQGSKWILNNDGLNTVAQEGEMVAFSLADGAELWRAPCFENYTTALDIFVMDGVVWVGNLRRNLDPGFTEGRDLKTGKVIATLPPRTAGGHHRCYRNKATVQWILIGRQGDGIQFLDPKDGNALWHGWVRGTCQYGIMPANGLVYAPPHACACNPEEMLIGFNALSAHSSAGEGSEPLDKGPAYSDIPDPERGLSEGDWPTYRRDAGRSGYQNLPAPKSPKVTWSRTLSPPITAPVVAHGLVVAAETDRHTVHALSAADGEPVWAYVADGRIDSPPTLFGGLCLFGTRNGFVYALRASDGALVWRFRAAPRDRRLFSYGQIESVWPVHGSVLVDDTLHGGTPVVYFAAGRSPRLDGGIRLYALEAATGKLLHQAGVDMAFGGDRPGIIRQRVLPDILSLQKGLVWMRHLGVDKDLVPARSQPHLYAPRGFLDDTWWHRTYWIYGSTVLQGFTAWPIVGNVVPAGRLLALDGEHAIYGYGRTAYRALSGGHVRSGATQEYALFAETLSPDSAAPATNRAFWDIYNRRRDDLVKNPDIPRHRLAEMPYDEVRKDFRARQMKWTVPLSFVARSIVLSRDALLVAGGESLTQNAEHYGPGTFRVASREDGSKMASCALPAPPVLDGLALTDTGVFVSAVDGSLSLLSDAE